MASDRLLPHSGRMALSAGHEMIGHALGVVLGVIVILLALSAFGVL